jgi:hypothetical protein
MDELTLVGLFIVLMIALLTLFYESRVRAGLGVQRRELPGLRQVEKALSRAAETGRPIHLSPGAGPLAGQSVSPETYAGLLLSQRIGALAASRGARIAASSGDAATHLALRGIIHQAYEDAGYEHDYDASALHLYAHSDPLALNVGLGNRYQEEPFEASIAVGAFGTTYLLAGAQGAQRQVPQVSGTTTPESLAAMVLTSDATLMGEDIYAAEAYLAPSPTGFARLLTHDLLRTLVITLLVVATLLQLLQIAGVDVGNLF